MIVKLKIESHIYFELIQKSNIKWYFLYESNKSTPNFNIFKKFLDLYIYLYNI